MAKERGIIYILTNPMFREDVIKIGITKDLSERLKQLGRETGVPCPFECYIAYEIDNYKQVEKIMHSIYRGVERHTDKEHKNKEFFQVHPSRADEVLSKLAELLNGKKVIVDNNKIYTPEQQQILEESAKAAEKNQIAKRFKFQDYNIPVGATLFFIKNDKIRCKVTEDNKVIYNGEEFSLSRLTINLMQELGYSGKHYNGYNYWLYNDTILTDMSLSTEEQD